MRFGLQKLTLLDYPGNVACTVFCSGCNFRCPYCHNSRLVISKNDDLEYSRQDIFDFLETRKGRLDGVCISGGEPLLNPNLKSLMERIKEFGFKIKLDTNGSFPEYLRSIAADGLIDYVAMDIKNSPEKYLQTCGFSDMEKIEESISFLLSGAVNYEFRTTVTGTLHEESDFEKIGRRLQQAEHYFLQPFRLSEEILNGGAEHTVSEDKMKKYLQIVQKYIPSAEIRGL